MNTYPSPSYGRALEGPSDTRTAANAYRDAARSQSPQDPYRQSTISNSYAPVNQQANSSYQPFQTNLAVNTNNQNLGRNDNRYPVQSAQPLINRMDNILQQSQSPTRNFSSPERKDLPLSQSNFQNQGIYGSPAYSYPLNSARSQPVGDSSPSNFRTSINPLKDSQTFSNAPRSVDKNTELFPIQESLRGSYLSVSEPRYSDRTPQVNGGVGDLQSRLSNLESQLNALDGKGNNRTGYQDSYNAPRSLSPGNNNYSSANWQNNQQNPSGNYPTYSQPAPWQNNQQNLYNRAENYPAQPQTTSWQGTQQNPIGNYPVNSQTSPWQNNQQNPSGNYPSYSQNGGYAAPVATNPRQDAAISDQIVKKIDDLMNTHIFENRSPSRPAALSQRNHYTSPSRETSNSFTSPLSKSTVAPKTESYRSVTPPMYQSTYDSKYDPYPTYDSRPNYHKSTTVEPARSVTPPPYQSTYDSYPSKYDSYSTYESRPNYSSSSTYEPLPKYDSEYRSYEPHYSSSATYEPRYDHERDLYSKPYASSSLHRPYTSDYDTNPTNRQKYIRPLYRNTPEKYRPASSYSYYPSDYYHSTSMNSTPSRDYPDYNYTDKKLKKLTLKSKPSEDRDEQAKQTPIKNPIRHQGTKRPKFKGGDLLSDNEDPNVLPLPRMEEPSSSYQRRVRPVDNRLRTYNAGDLRDDSRPVDNTVRNYHAGDLVRDDPSLHYESEEEPVKNARNQYQKANTYRAGKLESDTNFNAGELEDDEIPVNHDVIGGQAPEDRLSRSVRSAQASQPSNNGNVRKGNFRAGDLEADTDHNAGGLLEDEKGPKSQVRVNRHHAGELRNDGVPVKTRNVADDGKAWNMPHKLPSEIFEETDGSMFDFEENDRKQSTRPTRQTITKQSVSQRTGNNGKSKGVIWALDDESQRRNVSNVSSSMRRSDRNPVVSESFDKYGRLGY